MEVHLSDGRRIIGRDNSQLDFYKVIDWRGRLYYLVVLGKDRYRWFRCYDWGKVEDYFVSKSNPIEFISDMVRAVNSETSTGVKLIKQIKRLPFSKAVTSLEKKV